jgi:hypothetical protein
MREGGQHKPLPQPALPHLALLLQEKNAKIKSQTLQRGEKKRNSQA